MKEFDLIVIGGCSAGLAAAISAKRNHPELNIAILEKLPRVGKKILATGNGRCNLTNLNALSHPYHNAGFAEFALNKYSPEKVIGFFGSLGLMTRVDGERRVYPRSNNAASVLDALRFETEKLGISVFCDTTVSDIRKKNGRFSVNGEYLAEKIIIACGGKSSPSQGSDGSIFDAVRSLGHSFTPLYPALAPLICAKGETKALKGIRASGVELTARCGDKIIGASAGEILFTDSGISGIAAMELAAAVNENVKSKTFTDIDFLPELSEKEMAGYLREVKNIKGNLPMDELLTGILPKMLGIHICKVKKLYKQGGRISSLDDGTLVLLSKALKKFTVSVEGTRPFADSQVTRGGVKISEIDERTMKSRLCPGLSFAGEIIDVDGGCGGFNLQWAWSSGLLAGEMIKEN